MTQKSRQLAAIMFTDIVGYTAMMSRDEESTLQLIDEVRSRMKVLVDQFNGKWLKELGDGFLMSFDSGSRAVECAIEIQRMMQSYEAQLRIGIHVGEIIFRNGDVYGDGVNIASRLQEIAPAGGIYTSGRLYEDISNKTSIHAISLGHKTLKNLERPVEVYSITNEFLPLPEEYSEKQKRKRRYRIGGVASFLILLTVVVVAVFKLVQVSSGTSTVELTDEFGNVIEKEVANNQLIRKVGLFSFRNETDQDLSWLSVGIPYLLYADLDQDIFIQSRTIFDYVDDFQKAGADDITTLPISLIRQVSREYRLEYFVTGSFDREGDQYSYHIQLYDMELGTPIAEHTFTGNNIFSIVDQASRQLRNDLGVSEVHISGTTDLPVSELLTDSETAFQALIEGAMAYRLNNDFQNALKYFNQATELDPEFAVAYYELTALYVSLNQFPQAKESVQKVMDLIYKLTERDQFAAKGLYYFLTEDSEKRKKVFEMWLELYPEDLNAYLSLGVVNYYEGNWDEAARIFKKGLQVDDYRGTFLIYLGNIYTARKAYDSAQYYYDQFIEKYPENARSFRLMGDFQLSQGRFDEARTYFDKATLISPNDVEARSKLGLIALRLADYERALKIYQETLASCRTLQDSVNALTYLQGYYRIRGQITQELEVFENLMDVLGSLMGPLQVSIYRVTRLLEHFNTDRTEEALEILEREEKNLAESFADLVGFGYLNYYIQQGNIEKAEESYQRVERFIERYGSPGNIEIFYKGQILQMKDQPQEAIEQYLAFREKNNFFDNSEVDLEIAACYLAMNEEQKAIETINSSFIEYPNDPHLHLMMANIYHSRKEDDTAREHLRITMTAWEDADQDYKPAQKARALAEELDLSL